MKGSSSGLINKNTLKPFQGSMLPPLYILQKSAVYTPVFHQHDLKKKELCNQIEHLGKHFI